MNSRIFWAATCAILLLGASLRYWAASGELWLDEIWSYHLVLESGHSILHVLQIAHDNNHLLNSAYLCFVPESAAPVIFRLPSLAASILVISLMAFATFGASRIEKILAMLLAAVSLPLIVICTEARGYGTEVFFFLAAVVCLRRGLGSSLAYCVAAGGLAALAIVSHFLALFAYAGLVAYTVGAIFERKGFSRGGEPKKEVRIGGKITLAQILGAHIPPLATGALVCWYYLPRLKIGGGDATSFGDVFRDWFEYTVGFKSFGPGFLFCLLFVLLVAAGFRGIFKQRKWADASLFASIWIVSILYPLLRSHNPLYLRYFILLIPILYLMAAHGLVEWVEKSGKWRYLAIGTTLLFFCGQMAAFSSWIPYGRGGYAEAIQYVSDHETAKCVVLGGNQDWRNMLVAQHYAKKVEGHEWQYIPKDSWPAEGVAWFLKEDVIGKGAGEASALVDRSGNKYALAATFPYGGISGWNWMVYRRMP